MGVLVYISIKLVTLSTISSDRCPPATLLTFSLIWARLTCSSSLLSSSFLDLWCYLACWALSLILSLVPGSSNLWPYPIFTLPVINMAGNFCLLFLYLIARAYFTCISDANWKCYSEVWNYLVDDGQRVLIARCCHDYCNCIYFVNFFYVSLTRCFLRIFSYPQPFGMEDWR